LSKTSPRSILALIAFMTPIALGAAPAQAAPTVSYTVSPNPPVSGQSATYTSNSSAPGFTVTSVEWDFDTNPDFEANGTSVAHTYATAGTKTFRMRVTTDEPLDNQTTEGQTVNVAQANRPPTSAFAFSPSSPMVGDDVLFAENASDPDGNALTYLWNFGDNTSSTMRNPVHTYLSAGTKTVTLRVSDGSAPPVTSTRQVVVRGVLVPGNGLPFVNFAFSPSSPRVGESVEFVSSTTDPEGNLSEQAWDLDGDGEFDDARGDKVVYSFTTSGDKIVRQRATDAAGGTAIGERTVTVLPAPKAKAGFLSPSPVVTLTGEILSGGMRVKRLSVRGPRGALVVVKCRGKGCGVKRRRKRIKQGTAVRFKTYHRYLRAGIKLEIYVRKANTIGDYTRYKIRAGTFPVRTDRCLPVGKIKPSKSCS
jgi:PKD repeat protein